MRNTFLQLRKQMSYSGYYTQSDVGSFLKVSRQAVYKMIKENKFATTTMYGKQWVKFDEGQKGKEIFGENPLNQFLQFGFQKRTKNLLVANSCICDVKLIDSERLSVRFYDQNGDCISLIANLNTIEKI